MLKNEKKVLLYMFNDSLLGGFSANQKAIIQKMLRLVNSL
jgi:hypothetical protein